MVEVVRGWSCDTFNVTAMSSAAMTSVATKVFPGYPAYLLSLATTSSGGCGLTVGIHAFGNYRHAWQPVGNGFLMEFVVDQQYMSLAHGNVSSHSKPVATDTARP